jgi:hypothetical protein
MVATPQGGQFANGITWSGCPKVDLPPVRPGDGDRHRSGTEQVYAGGRLVFMDEHLTGPQANWTAAVEKERQRTGG